MIEFFQWLSAGFGPNNKLTVFKPPRNELRKLRELILKRPRKEL